MAWSEPDRIEVLGAVRAWQDGRELPLGPRQQRSVLALLAVAGGQPVPVPEIVEALWEARPPRSAANVVQTYLKRLRRILEPHRPARGPSRLLPAVNGGYALRAGPDVVDLWQFRKLARLAGEARRGGEHGRVVTLLTDALRLWQGPPGGDQLSHHHRLRATAEEHGTAVGWFAEAALVTGTAAEALPVVAQSAAGRPFDEPLHAHLIRLYHAAGRRSDAVRVYQGSWQRLRDELGLNPGPELTRAYRELLEDQRPWSTDR
jgi:DNA-binding SARP family transcriptional activator